MPVVWRKNHSQISIVVWKSLEPMSELLQNAGLSNQEVVEWKSFKSESRKREWLTVRNALKLLVPGANKATIYYDSNGKPQLLEEGFISISHSHEYIALMKSATTEIGVDIEVINERIFKLSEKFLSGIEKHDITTENKLEKLQAMWGAKEVLYKIHSVGGIDFKKDLLVHPFEYKSPGMLSASILKRGFQKDFNIYYEKIDQHMLSWAVGEND